MLFQFDVLVVNEESVPSSGQEIETYQQEEKVNELISFDSDYSKLNNKNLLEPADDVSTKKSVQKRVEFYVKIC